MTEIPAPESVNNVSAPPSEPKTLSQIVASSHQVSTNPAHPIFAEKVRAYRNVRRRARDGDPQAKECLEGLGRCILKSTTNDFINDLPARLRPKAKKLIRLYTLWVFNEVVHGRQVDLLGLGHLYHKWWKAREIKKPNPAFKRKSISIKKRWSIKLQQSTWIKRELYKLAQQVEPNEDNKMPINTRML